MKKRIIVIIISFLVSFIYVLIKRMSAYYADPITIGTTFKSDTWGEIFKFLTVLFYSLGETIGIFFMSLAFIGFIVAIFAVIIDILKRL